MPAWQLSPLRPHDLAAVCRLEERLFPTPWPLRSLQSVLSQAGAVGYVITSRSGAVESGDAGAGPAKDTAHRSGGAAGGGCDGTAAKNIAAFVLGIAIVDEVHILRIGVSPGMQRRGLATMLMEVLIRRARRDGMRSIGLEVRPSNAAALALYARMGFQEAGRWMRYYPETGEDAVILKKKL